MWPGGRDDEAEACAQLRWAAARPRTLLAIENAQGSSASCDEL